MYFHVYICIYFPGSMCRKSLEAKTLIAIRTPRAQILASTPLSIKRNQDSSGKWLIPGLGQGGFKMSLEHLAMSENKSSQKKKKEKNNDNGAYHKDLRASFRVSLADTG